MAKDKTGGDKPQRKRGVGAKPKSAEKEPIASSEGRQKDPLDAFLPPSPMLPPVEGPEDWDARLSRLAPDDEPRNFDDLLCDMPSEGMSLNQAVEYFAYFENIEQINISVRSRSQADSYYSFDDEYTDSHSERIRSAALSPSLKYLLKMQKVSASGFKNGSTKRETIDVEHWKCNDLIFIDGKAVCFDPKIEFTHVRVFRVSETAPEPAAATAQNPRGAGRKPRGDWPLILATWVDIVAKEGRLPESVEEMNDWVSDAADLLKVNHPAPATIREHFKRTFGDSFWQKLKN